MGVHVFPRFYVLAAYSVPQKLHMSSRFKIAAVSRERSMRRERKRYNGILKAIRCGHPLF
jgi:hypothetical protein